MTMISHRIAAALLLSTAGIAFSATPAAAAKEEKVAAPKLSKPVLAVLGDAQKAQKAGDNATALAKTKEADALPNLTPDEVYVINQFKLNAAIGLNDEAAKEEAINKMLDSGKAPPDLAIKFTKASAGLAINRKDYARATTQSEKLLQLQPNDIETLTSLGELYLAQNQPTKAVDAFSKAIAASKAAGQTAPENLYRRQFEIGYNKKLPNTPDMAVVLLQAYPNPVNWRDALNFSRDSVSKDDQALLDLLRLQSTVNALNGEGDYVGYAETAIEKGLPGEADMILKKGIAAGMVKASKQNVVEVQRVASSKLAKDRGDLPALERDAKTNPKIALVTADAYYGYGDYAKAASLYRMAVASPTVDADTANLRLGASLAQSGDKAGAAEAFKAVKAGTRATLAKYWLIYIGQPV